ncbi:MAG: hypothetical protein WDN29_02680 [Methylovirgula sp.]
MIAADVTSGFSPGIKLAVMLVMMGVLTIRLTAFIFVKIDVL